MMAGDKAGLVRFPRDMLRIELDDLERLGLRAARRPMVALLADLPLVPTAEDSAVLVGSERVALPCLAILGRRVGQGLRDHNVALMHDRRRLEAERLKMAFLRLDELVEVLPEHGARLASDAALFVVRLEPSAPPEVAALIAQRTAAGLATFASSREAGAAPAAWRRVELEPEG